jgi:electron transfer flavoprotein beta subunit
MKILAPIKRVPAPEQRIRVDARRTRIDASDVSFVINPFDAIALEESLGIRERGLVPVEILAVSIGGDECEEQLRTALAMGADRAMLIEVAGPLDPWNVARLLAALATREQPDLVLMGKQAIDDDANQSGQFLAALLGWPQATFASRIELDLGAAPAAARVSRETDSGIETVRLSLPAVITADLRLNEPRYASLPSIIKARKKTIERIGNAELHVELEPRVELLSLESAASERTCVRVKDAAELVHRLRHEAKVL